VEQAAEAVSAADRRALLATDRPWFGHRRVLLERAVRPMLVVMGRVDTEHSLQVFASEDEQPVETLATDAANPSFRVRLRARGADWVRMISMPSERKTSSKAALNLLSRSRMRKRGDMFCSDRVMSRLRACCTTQAPSGWAVTPARCTRRLSSSMKNSTYSRRSQTVSTVKKSQAMLTQLPRDWRAARAGAPSVGPAPADELLVPAQQRRRLEQERAPHLPRQNAAERREQGTIRRLEPRASDLTPEHVQLVAQDENLDLLRVLRAKPQRQQLEQTPKRPIQKRERHAAPSF
jgi:hypothetical protein